MGLTLQVNFGDLEKAAREFQQIKLRAEDITEAGQAIRLIIQQDVDLRFQVAPAVETGGEVYGGVQWRELSDSYLAARSDRLGGQILRDTGELQQSLTAEGHPYGVFSVSETEIVFGTALPKASRLQSDRPFLFWHPVLLQKVAAYLAGWIEGGGQ